MHARKTRERKKLQLTALKDRIDSLNAEVHFIIVDRLVLLADSSIHIMQNKRMRLVIDERYTAQLLVGLTCSVSGAAMASSMLCGDSYSPTFDLMPDDTPTISQKRSRRPGKYTQQERETFRRERNRLHAKKTREKKKLFLEYSEQMIVNMEHESKILRDYLVSIDVMTIEEAVICEENDKKFRSILARLKNEAELDDDDIEDDKDGRENGEDEEMDSVDNERVENCSNGSANGSWNGSNDSSNGESSNGTTGESSSNNGGATSTDGSDKHDCKDNDSDQNGSNPMDDESQYADLDAASESSLVNKSSLDAHNSKHRMNYHGTSSAQRGHFVQKMI